MGKTHNIFPISTYNMSNFIANLHNQGYKSNSIRSYVAGLGYFHSLLELPNPSNHSLIKSLLKGSSKITQSPDIRLPISQDILIKMLKAVNRLLPSAYDRTLYSSMFTLAFHALLRIGEYTVKGSSKLHTLKLNHIQLLSNQSKISELRVSIPHFKHSAQPVTLSLMTSVHTSYCPTRL